MEGKNKISLIRLELRNTKLPNAETLKNFANNFCKQKYKKLCLALINKESVVIDIMDSLSYFDDTIYMEDLRLVYQNLQLDNDYLERTMQNNDIKKSIVIIEDLLWANLNKYFKIRELDYAKQR